MSFARVLPAVLASACAAGCSGGREFRALFGEREAEFNCELQRLHLDSSVKVRELPPGAGPGDMMMGLEPGGETIAWLYHFEDDGTPLKDDEAAYTIAVALKKREPGYYLLPSDNAAVFFFCDNWGRGLRAAEARGTGGWVSVEEVDARKMAGQMSVTLSGFALRPDRSREGVKVNLEGRFRTSP